jgi:tetratricopeptide (TPR) repeat protein
MGLAGSAATAAPPKQPQKQEAQKLANEGRALVKQGKFAEAAKKFKRADDANPSVAYKLEMAKLLIELGDLKQAHRVLKDAVDMKAQQFNEKQAQKKANDLLQEVAERTPTLKISVLEPEANKVRITVDGEEYDTGDGAIPVNPGSVAVEATATGYEAFNKTLKLAEGKRESLAIRLKAQAKTEEESGGSGLKTRIPAYVAWGVGAVGLGVGIGFGIMAIKSTNDVVNLYGCQDNTCPPDAEEDLDVAKANGHVSTAGFVIAGAGAATGTILFLLADDGDTEGGPDPDAGTLKIEARPLVGPGYVGLSGRF